MVPSANIHVPEYLIEQLVNHFLDLDGKGHFRLKQLDLKLIEVFGILEGS